MIFLKSYSVKIIMVQFQTLPKSGRPIKREWKKISLSVRPMNICKIFHYHYLKFTMLKLKKNLHANLAGLN